MIPSERFKLQSKIFDYPRGSNFFIIVLTTNYIFCEVLYNKNCYLFLDNLYENVKKAKKSK